ncbi:MAG: hypothetical protein ACI81I_000986, partial [Arcobacteraceae bacterium]
NKAYVDGRVADARTLATEDPARFVAVAAGYDIVIALDNRTWLDRNLGASQAAASATDILAYGGLFQWGRKADGHELRVSSSTTDVKADAPINNKFIINSSDWRVTSNDLLWDGVYALNNPCPMGFRLPTKAEFTTLLEAETITDNATAYSSTLKFTGGGYRNYEDGILGNFATNGLYWTSSVDGSNSWYANITSTGQNFVANKRTHGFSVRCVMD